MPPKLNTSAGAAPPLQKAVTDDDPTTVIALLKQGENPEALLTGTNNALTLAVTGRHLKALQAILNPHNAYHPTQEGFIPAFYLAAKQNDGKMLGLFITKLTTVAQTASASAGAAAGGAAGAAAASVSLGKDEESDWANALLTALPPLHSKKLRMVNHRNLKRQEKRLHTKKVGVRRSKRGSIDQRLVITLRVIERTLSHLTTTSSTLNAMQRMIAIRGALIASQGGMSLPQDSPLEYMAFFKALVKSAPPSNPGINLATGRHRRVGHFMNRIRDFDPTDEGESFKSLLEDATKLNPSISDDETRAFVLQYGTSSPEKKRYVPGKSAAAAGDDSATPTPDEAPPRAPAYYAATAGTAIPGAPVLRSIFDEAAGVQQLRADMATMEGLGPARIDFPKSLESPSSSGDTTPDADSLSTPGSPFVSLPASPSPTRQ